MTGANLSNEHLRKLVEFAVRRQPAGADGVTKKQTGERGCLGVAIASCSVKNISRGQGRSAVAAAAYRSGTKIQNAYDGLSHDYTRKTGIAYTAILAPQNSPGWVYDRAQLWNQAELTERRGNSRLAREVMIALPRELSHEQNIQLARAYAETFVKQGMVADLAVHDSRDGNPHAHIMLTTRLLDGDKFGKKCRDWDSREKLIEWREQYAELTNQYLERYEHDQRIDARSYVAQGVNQIPTIHLGPYAHRMKQQGVYTERWEINQRIEEQNKEIEAISRQINEYEKEVKQLRIEIAEEERLRQEKLEKQSTEAQEPSKPEPASGRYNRLIERYRMVSQSIQETAEALQHRLTEKGMKGLADQEQSVDKYVEILQQRTPKPDTSPQETQVKSERQKRYDDYRRLYEAPVKCSPDLSLEHTGDEESGGKLRKYYDTVDTLPKEPESPPHHPRDEQQSQKRKEHRLVRSPERQNRRYQNTYKQAEQREERTDQTVQTSHHNRPELPNSEQRPDYRGKYKIVERRQRQQERRYQRSHDEPEHKK